MATCADCAHVEVCKFKDLPAPLSDSYIRESECIENRCGNFKNRSRFVELPCKVGDIVYGVNGHPDYGYEIAVSQVKDVALICRCGDLSYSRHLNSFGKTIFLTKEQAEQALKELERE